MGNLTTEEVAVVITAMTDPEERWFRFALASVLEQSVQPSQILILISQRNTWAELEVRSLSQEGLDTSKVSLYPIPLASPASVRNTAIGYVAARWVAFLDADDVWMPNKLEMQLAATDQEDVDFIGTDYIFTTSDGKRFGYSNGSTPTPSSWMVRTDVMKEYPFDAELTSGEDHFWLLKTKGHVKRLRLPIILVEYRIRAGSISVARENSMQRFFREIAARLSNLGLIRTLLVSISYLRYRLYRNKPYDL